MADYDVGVLALSSPPSRAVLQSYRPAVSVRNNGIHDALASGTLRIYSAGLLIFTTELYSATISPGQTRDALATDYWTPPSAGAYMAIADISCPLDQVESNNHLAPTWIAVSGEPPPPPPTVPYHASQHEEGAPDELIVDGLHGRLTDPQTALAHKISHQAAGGDELDLTGMGGILRDGQPIADHHESHENQGGDELNVTGLNGELYNLQKPKVHANEAHDPNYATSTELSNHLNDTTAVHAVATNLEQTSRKGDPDGYAELDSNGHVPSDQLADIPPEYELLLLARSQSGQSWAPMPDHAPAHEVAGGDEISIAGLAGNPSARGQANGIAPLDADSKVPTENLPPLGSAPHAATHENGGGDEISIADLAGNPAARAQANGLAPLDANSLVPAEYLPAGQGGQPNALYTKLALHSLQAFDAEGDTLILGALTTGTTIKPNWSMRIIITGYIDPHDQQTYMQIFGIMNQAEAPIQVCSSTVSFPGSPPYGKMFKYEARLFFRADSLSSFCDFNNEDETHRGGDESVSWNQLNFTSWQWYAHLGIPTLSVHIFSRQCILEPYTA